jgi:hypothetical protein
MCTHTKPNIMKCSYCNVYGGSLKWSLEKKSVDNRHWLNRVTNQLTNLLNFTSQHGIKSPIFGTFSTTEHWSTLTFKRDSVTRFCTSSLFHESSSPPPPRLVSFGSIYCIFFLSKFAKILAIHRWQKFTADNGFGRFIGFYPVLGKSQFSID